MSKAYEFNQSNCITVQKARIKDLEKENEQLKIKLEDIALENENAKESNDDAQYELYKLKKENEQLKQQLFEARKDYLIETADISDKLYLDDEIEKERREIFGDVQ